MNESELHQQAEEIHEQLPAAVDVTPSDIEDRLTTLVTDYKVPLDEARRSIINTYLEESNATADDLQNTTQEVDLVEITEPDQWIDVTAKVVDLLGNSERLDRPGWPPRRRNRHDQIHEMGEIGLTSTHRRPRLPTGERRH